jgi:hypothetical protein
MEAFTQWSSTQRQALKRENPAEVLQALRRVAAAKKRGEAPAVAMVQDRLADLEKRRAMIASALFQAQGCSIGSGSVESANKLVVESWLKGACMYWARPHVNPMMAQSTIPCSDRWMAAWPQIADQWRRQGWQRRAHQHGRRQQPQRPAAVSPLASVRPRLMPITPPVVVAALALATPPSPPLTAPKMPYPRLPDHSCRHFCISRSGYQRPRVASSAKLGGRLTPLRGLDFLARFMLSSARSTRAHGTPMILPRK